MIIQNDLKSFLENKGKIKVILFPAADAGNANKPVPSYQEIHSSARKNQSYTDVLYMYSINAKKTNTASKALYARLQANGKTGKQALIAVGNKLVKQVCTVVKNNSRIKRIIVQLIRKNSCVFTWFFIQFM